LEYNILNSRRLTATEKLHVFWKWLSPKFRSGGDFLKFTGPLFFRHMQAGYFYGPWIYYFLHLHIFLWQKCIPTIFSELYVDSHKGIILLSGFITGAYHYAWWTGEHYYFPRITLKHIPILGLAYLSAGMAIDFFLSLYEPWNPKKRLNAYTTKQAEAPSWVSEEISISQLTDLYKRDSRLAQQMDIDFIKKPPTRSKDLEWLYEASQAAKVQGEQVERYYRYDDVDYSKWSEPFTYHHLWDTDIDWNVFERDGVELTNWEMEEHERNHLNDERDDYLYDDEAEENDLDENDYEDEIVITSKGPMELSKVTDEEFWEMVEQFQDNVRAGVWEDLELELED